jgi:hypothetical protein
MDNIFAGRKTTDLLEALFARPDDHRLFMPVFVINGEVSGYCRCGYLHKFDEPYAWMDADHGAILGRRRPPCADEAPYYLQEVWLVVDSPE